MNKNHLPNHQAIAHGLRPVFLILALSVVTFGARAEVLPRHGLYEVNHDQVELRGGFWGPRLKTAEEVTIPHALNRLEADGHLTNFDKAAGKFDGPYHGHHAFDSDLFKALEGACDSLQHFEDPPLRRRVDGILGRILAAQKPDGYLNTYFLTHDYDKRWDDLRLEHQMYNAGHFFEMAVAQNQLTREANVLNAAKRYADLIDSIFGPGKRYDVDGHEEVELALVKLYRATGERRYLELSKFFLDERGYAHGMERKPFDPATIVPPPKPQGPQTPEQRRANFQARLRVRNGRMQDHKPLVQQFEAVGHAVRAGYVYSAMTDLVRFTDAPDYDRALDHLWTDVVSHKIYLTGGIGTAQYGDEGFGDPYLLPNESAYCESCAAIANVLWQHRMNLLKAQARYADVMELTLYNGVLAGISIAGDAFFYQNPLASAGERRSTWIGLACCPSNLERIIPQVGGLAYACGPEQIYVNLYAAGEASIRLDHGIQVKLTQQTEYPWDGGVRLTVKPERPAAKFDLCLRIPGWAMGHPVPSDLYRFAEAKVSPLGLKVNGRQTAGAPQADGYLHLQRTWKAGDVVELNVPMPVQQVHANEKVQADQGSVALMRGPLVYCFEAADQPGVDMSRLVLSQKPAFRAVPRADRLGGVTVLEGEALAEGQRPVAATAVPYYAWGNREKGAMKVWIGQAPVNNGK